MKKYVFISMLMNKFFLFIILILISMSASAQMERICPTCKKVLSKCSYKGKHPKEAVCPICKKVVSKCAYKGKHPQVVTPTIDKTIMVDGMEYRIRGKEATLIKGKAAISISIPKYVNDDGKDYPVVSIGAWAFCHGIDNNELIESITIPDGVKSIKDRAFQHCWGLKYLSIPASVTEIKDEPFFDCYGLKSIVVDPNNKVFDSRNNCNAIIETKTGSLLKGCINTIIPQGIKSIGSTAFKMSAIKTSIIPNSVDSIRSWAFSDCKGLIDVSLPTNLKYIGTQAFAGCLNLKTIDLPISAELWDGCFWGSGLEKIYIPQNVKLMEASIRKDGDANPFTSCHNLSEIVVDKDNPYYDSRNNCNAIIDRKTNVLMVGCKNTTIPYGVIKIGDEAFSGCKELVSIPIPNSVRKIGHYAFSRCSNLKGINIPANVESIGSCAFLRCSRLSSITISNGINHITCFAFAFCTNLSSVSIPNSVSSIGESAFLGCKSLKSVLLPSKMKTIGKSAFEDSGLETIKIPNGVEISTGAIPTSTQIIRY